MIASHKGHLEVVDKLLQHGATLDLLNEVCSLLSALEKALNEGSILMMIYCMYMKRDREEFSNMQKICRVWYYFFIKHFIF